MTVNYKNGNIVLSKEAEQSKDFVGLKGLSVSKSYIDCERRHYLEWHNDRFLEQNPD